MMLLILCIDAECWMGIMSDECFVMLLWVLWCVYMIIMYSLLEPVWTRLALHAASAV